jgi:hypothetical protein
VVHSQGNEPSGSMQGCVIVSPTNTAQRKRKNLQSYYESQHALHQWLYGRLLGQMYGEKLTALKSKLNMNFCSKSENFFIIHSLIITSLEILKYLLSMMKLVVICVILHTKRNSG